MWMAVSFVENRRRAQPSGASPQVRIGRADHLARQDEVMILTIAFGLHPTHCQPPVNPVKARNVACVMHGALRATVPAEPTSPGMHEAIVSTLHACHAMEKRLQYLARHTGEILSEAPPSMLHNQPAL